MKALNPKNQSKLNKVVKALTRYNELNDARGVAENNDDERLERKLNRQCESAWDKYLEYMDELPKYQQKLVENSTLYKTWLA